MNLIKYLCGLISIPFKSIFAVIKAEKEVREFARVAIKRTNKTILDAFSNLHAICRIGWDHKKDIPKGQPYYLNPYYGYPGEQKYNETDESLRRRVLQHIKEQNEQKNK